ncbi:hypothetical protein CsSME_00013624 [Camellia sinensis var. sinensis]
MVFMNKVDHVILEVELVASSNEYFGSLVLEAAHDREKELLQEITDLQWRLICAQEELQKYKTDNAHLDFLPYSCFI